jgi:hypothetical protein
MLDHLWDRRALTRHLFEPPLQAKLQRRLAKIIETKSPPCTPAVGLSALAARGSAAHQFVVLQMWLSGEAACRSDDLANMLVDIRR